MSAAERSTYRFGGFELDSARRRLLKNGCPVGLTPKALELLLALVRNSGRLVTRDELTQMCWPNTFVQDANLTNHVFALRTALGEQPNEHRFIVTVPGHGYRFVAEVTTAAREATAPVPPLRIPSLETTVEIRSIAVLPFRVIGSTQREQFMALGLSEALATRLSRLRNLAVRPTASIPNRQRSSNPLTLAKRLGVDAVLLGSIQREGRSVRVNVQLIRSGDGTMVWANQFDERVVHLFKIEDAVTDLVVRGLSVTLSREEERRIVIPSTENPQAYQAYLRGRFFWNKRTETGLKAALACFQQAIESDPRYALAHVGVADSYNVLNCYSAVPPGEAGSAAKDAAQTALAIDDSLAEAHSSLALASVSCWEWDEARSSFQRALEINSRYPSTYQWYADFLTVVGQFDEALDFMQRARQLDPLSLVITTNIAYVLFFARRYDEAMAQARRALDLDPYFAPARWLLALSLEQQGEPDSAIQELEAAIQASQGSSPFLLATSGHALARAGRVSEARHVLDELRGWSEEHYVSPYGLALIHLALGDRQQALEHLGVAFEERSYWLSHLAVDPRVDQLRGDPAFERMVAGAGLPG